MKLHQLILIVAALSATPAEAKEVDVFLACTALDNDIERLQCFDAAANSLTTDPPPSNATDPGSPSKEREVAVREEASSEVKEADEKMVEHCEFLGTVGGKSGWGGLAAGKARKGAMRSVKKRAAKLGATHVVIGGFDVGSGVTMEMTTLQGRAYRCPAESSQE